MKPFRFSLQAVLTVRLNQESKAMELFVRAQTEHQKNLARQRAIREEMEEIFERRRDTLRKAAASEDIHEMQLGLRALQESMRLCQLDLQRSQANFDEKSRALLQARQKREAVDKLHEKQFAGYQTQVSREEQKLADDLATLKSVGSLALKWK
jgi:flagellar export protein FliJ